MLFPRSARLGNRTRRNQVPAHFRLHIDGSWPAAGEVFSTSFAATSPGGTPDQGPLTAWAQAVFDYWAAAGAGVQPFLAMLGSTGQIDRIRIYWHPEVGAPAALAAVGTGTPEPGSGVINKPPQIARVYTLLTGVPGRSFRGRMYWPCVTGSVTSSFKDSGVSSSNAQFFAAVLASMTNLNGEALPIEPAVVSVTRGLVTPVTQVAVGDVLDTQRRRRDNLQEIRFTAPIP